MKVKSESEVAQSCLTLSDPMDCSLPGSSIHGIFQARVLEWYKNIKKITIEDIIDFHFRFECIHPFGDGNGRVGRMIIFKECLKNNVMPFIVLDDDKPYYMRGLKSYKKDKMFLIDTIKHEQDLYESVASEMLDFDLEDK